jgi:murein L,D-transpeptidase YcbB/YkuD
MRKRLENLKFSIVSVLVILLFLGAGYWAFSSIESGTSHIDLQKQKTLEQKIKELTDENYQLKRQLGLLEEKNQEDNLAEIEAKNQEVEKLAGESAQTASEPTNQTPSSNTQTKTYKYQSLIDEIQNLINKGVFLKLKSQGASVGTVQKFLNLYNNTNNKIDNDYGPGTVTAVKNFQKAQGLTVDGEAGPGTFKKMISWLKTK